MDDATDDRLTGRCLCGAVAITIEQRRAGVDVCHCEMCRRWCGGPFFSLRNVTADAFDIRGAEQVNSFRSSDWAERASCAACGSSLWYRFLPGGTYALAAGLFDLPAHYHIREQIFVDERPDWARLAAVSDEKTGAEVLAEVKSAGFDFDAST